MEIKQYRTKTTEDLSSQRRPRNPENKRWGITMARDKEAWTGAVEAAYNG